MLAVYEFFFFVRFLSETYSGHRSDRAALLEARVWCLSVVRLYTARKKQAQSKKLLVYILHKHKFRMLYPSGPISRGHDFRNTEKNLRIRWSIVKDSFKNQIRSNLAHVCTQKALHSCMYQPTTDFGNSKWEVSYFDVRCLFWQPLKRWSRQLHLQSIITNCRMAMLDDPFKCRLDNFTLNVQPYPMRQSKPVGVVITRHSAAQSRSPDPIDFHRFRIISYPSASCGWMSTVIPLRTG